MPLRELVTVLRYQLHDGELKRYLDGAKSAEKAINTVAQVAAGKLNNALQKNIRTTGQMERRTNDVAAVMNRLVRRTQDFTSSLQQAARRGLGEVNRQMERLESRSANLRGRLVTTTVATGAALAVLRKPVVNSANFDRENQLIGNTANMSPAEIEKLRKAILREARATNQDANELQRAIGFLVAAGMDANTAQASIRTIGRATTAAGADIEDMARAAFTLQDALKIKPSRLEGALDILAMAGKEGNVELADMAKTLPVLGSAFGALKMEGTEAAATMAAALEVARKGSATADEAATNLQNFLGKILSPETLNKAEKAFGLDLYGVVQQAQKTGANPFEAAMGSIIKATGGDQKKIGELFGDMQVQNFLRPMIQNWDEYERIKRKSLMQSGGTTNRDFARMMQTDAEKMKAVTIAADNLSKSLGRALSPALNRASELVANFLNKLTAWVDQHQDLAATIAVAVVALGSLKAAIIALQIAAAAAQGIRGLSAVLGAGGVGEAGGSKGGKFGLLGRIPLIGALSALTFGGLDAAGVAPAPWNMDKKSGADAVRKGSWFSALAKLGAADFSSALFGRNVLGLDNNQIADMLTKAGTPNPWNVGAEKVTPAAGRVPWMVQPQVTQNATVNVTAPSMNPAAVGAAAQRGTTSAMSSFSYHLPTPVEQL